MAGGTDFKSGKFKELVLYLAQSSADDKGFGMVKLNKLLFRADTEAFRLLGASITGETYMKQEFGPVAGMLPIALDELAGRGYIVWQHPDRGGGFASDVPAALEPPDLESFSTDELEVIDRALAELSPHGGKSVSEWSHQESAGWIGVEIGQEIPYIASLIDTSPPDERVFEAFRKLHNVA
jgi:hypothetical protein